MNNQNIPEEKPLPKWGSVVLTPRRVSFFIWIGSIFVIYRLIFLLKEGVEMGLNFIGFLGSIGFLILLLIYKYIPRSKIAKKISIFVNIWLVIIIVSLSLFALFQYQKLSEKEQGILIPAGAEKTEFSQRENLKFTDYTCSSITNFAEENPKLHQTLLENKGETSFNYRLIWDDQQSEFGHCFRESYASESIEVKHTDVTGDGEKEIIIVYNYQGESKSLGVFQLEEDKYIKILDKRAYSAEFAIENNQLIEVYAFYSPTQNLINQAHIYYEFVPRSALFFREASLKVNQIVDDFGNDITESYPVYIP
ncbi:MAG: hypothetical protein Q8P63_01175 [Candidatus Nealsonbacteria bacterium]|nr:hypothetical protein [Candidatus Nealsonbacteria bacterium]